MPAFQNIRLYCSTALATLFLFAGPAPAQGVANGVFLVAQPSLNDGLFGRSVILITQPSASRTSGPMGVIINKPSRAPLSRVFPKHPRIAALPGTLHIGGPVARQSLVFLVRGSEAPPRAMHVLDDVFMTGDADWVESALADDQPAIEVRVYSGYSGWAPGQLQNELDREGWYMLPASADAIFGDGGAQLWQDLVKRALLRSTLMRRTPRTAVDVNTAGFELTMETR